MKIKIADEIGENLPNRLRLLSKMIARKPNSYTNEWATTPKESFRLYTRTSTINIIGCVNNIFTEFDYPFPSYIDISNIHKEIVSLSDFPDTRIKRIQILQKIRQKPNLGALMILRTWCPKAKTEDLQKDYDYLIKKLFRNHKGKIFNDLSVSPILHTKKAILRDIERAYKQKMWAACITTTIPLLDHIIRHYCESGSLRVSIKTLHKAFFVRANLSIGDLLSGFSIWKEKVHIKNVEEDLRLPGIYLASFFEFSKKYYEDYDYIGGAIQSSLNRHAIIHGGTECWSEENAVRILTFLHLTVHLEEILKILLQKSDEQTQ